MLKKLLSSFQPGKKGAAPAPTPNIRRVIKASERESEPEIEYLDAAEVPEFDAPEVISESVAAAEDAIDSLAERFEVWMRMDLDTLVDTWKAAQEPGAGPDKYRALFTAAHNIKGAANSYGYPSIARLCASLSQLLTATAPGDNSPLINIHVEACRAAFNAAGDGKGAESIADAVCDALEQRVALKVAQS